MITAMKTLAQSLVSKQSQPPQSNPKAKVSFADLIASRSKKLCNEQDTSPATPKEKPLTFSPTGVNQRLLEPRYSDRADSDYSWAVASSLFDEG